MTYSINSPHKEKMIHSKGMTDNFVAYRMLDYITEGIDFIIYNINGEVV